jgi:hypothetical protein
MTSGDMLVKHAVVFHEAAAGTFDACAAGSFAARKWLGPRTKRSVLTAPHDRLTWQKPHPLGPSHMAGSLPATVRLTVLVPEVR